MRLLHSGSLEVLQDHLGKGLLGPVFVATFLRRVDQFVILVHAEHPVGAQALHRERTGHWRHHKFSSVRPFFCQVEAVETAIWLTEVAAHSRNGRRFLDHLVLANKDANPELMRLALKLATGAGKTTVMAMLIAWQTIKPRAGSP